MFAGSFPVLRADFHAVRDDNRISASLNHVVGTFAPLTAFESGEWVQLRDDESGTVLGIIEQRAGQRIHVKLDWATWSPTHAYWLDDFEILSAWFNTNATSPSIGAITATIAGIA